MQMVKHNAEPMRAMMLSKSGKRMETMTMTIITEMRMKTPRMPRIKGEMEW